MTATARAPVLIVGAGPTGLAAALFLAHRGVAVRIIDAAPEPSTTSKALLVNPRTLEILHDSGVAARIMTEGVRLVGACMHRGAKVVATLDVLKLLPGQPLIGLSQARTETLLNKALEERGVTVERGTSLQTLQQDTDRVLMTLRHADGQEETATAALAFGADGARSAVRQQLGLAFEGTTLPEPWQLWDIQLRTTLDPQRAHVVLLPDGFMFMVALRDDIWRVIANTADPLAQLPEGCVTGRVEWQSTFRIGHRLASRACVGRVALGGDAAHIHSPLGARGMNLGIEDAWVFAHCAADAMEGSLQRMREYALLREPVHHDIVKKIAVVTRLMRGKPAALARIRNVVAPQLVQLPVVQRMMAATISGMDHPLRIHP
ncbi:FAD-dependent oxidoreductase [Dyella psychrodurans]|uniref:FAD-dependent oxidoreductase n=1 Tax=Dyella psychrodurans TaxID=1927960 RepID=A0A370X743_9GAMM|nr:FAD-dependent oxidoreductase [Dyella psychrodurans]RDS84015.1 FAD-dependent oxidoreductase [Dyella psychrodurans]